MFEPKPAQPWAQRTRAWLDENLTAREISSARRSILNAHYTSPLVAGHMWDLARALGWPGGRVLEPGCGIGVFMATAPPGAEVVGVELDPVTAEIAASLHRGSHQVVNQSLEELVPGDWPVSMAIGNVPFADLHPNDKVYNPGRKLALHNYAIVKALAAVEPGGPVIVITSPYTLDALGRGNRIEIARYGEFAGSLRLPEVAFKKQSGTSVTTDVLVFRRRPEVLSADEAREATEGQEWLETHSLPVTDKVTGEAHRVTVNAVYRHAAQANIVGELTTGGMYSHDSSRVVIDPDRYETALAEAFTSLLDQARSARPTRPAVVDAAPPMPSWVKPGGLFGSRSTGFWQRTKGDAVARYEPSPKKDARVLDAYLRLRDAYFGLIAAEQQPDTTDDDLAPLRRELNAAYDATVTVLGHPLNEFRETVDKNGVVTRRYPPMGGARRHDSDYFAILGLEHYDRDTGRAQKAAIFDERQVQAPRPVEQCDTIEEALAVSLAETGAVDVGRVASLLDMPTGAAAEQLARGHAFLDHESSTDRWVLAATYLCGDVRTKHREAVERAETDTRFTVNVAALEKVIPADLEPEDISVQLGAPWLTAEEVTAFLREALNSSLSGCKIVFHPSVGWKMSFPGHLGEGELMRGTYGTRQMSALQIAATALEGKPVRVMREVTDADGNKRRVLDRDATIEANAKLDELNNALVNWVRDDPVRASRLAQRYNRLFRSHAPPSYAPIWPRPPGLANHIELRDHQNSALTRALLNGSLGLFHSVGAGKTITMASIAMEARRIGLARKPLMAVPNHLVEQIAVDFLRAYPGANVLLPADRSAKGRASLVSSIAAGDWDAVIFSYEMFKAIPVSVEAEIDYLTSRAEDLRQGATAMKQQIGGRSGSTRGVKQVEKLIARFEEQIKELRDKPRDPTLTFEALGVDALIADEAHYAKNLVLGGTNSEVATRNSQRALDLDLKIQILRQRTDNQARLVLSTGTPVSNSFAELWVMMRYLQPDVLEAAAVSRFDEFVAQFGRMVTEFEMHATGTYRLTSRLAEFQNVPELQLLFRQTADVRHTRDLGLDLPDLKGGKREPIVVRASPELKAYVAGLAERAEKLDRSSPDVDNMLKIYSDGRAAALSLQLVGRPEPTPSKLDLAAERIVATWEQTRDNTFLDPRTGDTHPIHGALQIVFMDQGVPTSISRRGVNLYEQLRQLLVQGGMPPSSIVFIHESDDNEKLFDRCRQGYYSVLIGSTEKMGTGMNVQHRAVSLVHMDPTWRPADMEQREGRILRQGNQNRQVTIYNMLAEGSTDALLYQGLERKARMIDQVLSGANTSRTVNDVDSALIQFGDMKALATGNPLVVEQLDLKRQISELEVKQRAWNDRAARLAKGVPRWTERAARLEPRVAALKRFEADSTRLDIRSRLIECFGKTAESLADADRQLRTFAYKIRASGDRGDGRDTKRMEIGKLGPWPVRAVWHYDALSVTIEAADYDLTFDLTIVGDDLQRDSTARLWQRITNQPLRGLTDRIKMEEDDLQRTRSDLQQAERYADKPFPDQPQLDKLRGRLAQVEHDLSPESRLTNDLAERGSVAATTEAPAKPELGIEL